MISTEGAEVALVTGGGSGIGEAVAHALAAEGLRVVIADIDQDACSRVAAAIAAEGGIARGMRADIRDADGMRTLIRSVSESWQPPSRIAHCAAVLHFAPALETDLTAFETVIATNLTGAFIVNREAVLALVEAGSPGSIVNVSSIHALLSEPGATAYTAAKGGVESMTRTTATEWAQYGIRVNCVRPGATRTAMTDAIYTPTVLRALDERIPMQRPAAPGEIAAAITFLLSPAASYITGATLDVDGGYIMNGSLPGAAYLDTAEETR